MPTTISSSSVIKDQEDRSQAEVDLSGKGEAKVAVDCITLVKCAGGSDGDFSFVDSCDPTMYVRLSKSIISYKLRKIKIK